MVVARLGSPELSQDHRFRGFGYRVLDKYQGLFSFGIIIGNIPFPVTARLQVEPLQLESPSINRGMSGAAVLDSVHNQVVGIISENWVPPDGSTIDRNTCFAVDARVLMKHPMNLSLDPLPEAELPELSSMPPSSRYPDYSLPPSPSSAISSQLTNAPAILESWVGRATLIDYLNRDWRDFTQAIVGLIGFGGEGKSSLARQWINLLMQATDQKTPVPDGVFWWSFYDNPTVEVFFESLLTFLVEGIDLHRLPSASIQSQFILALLGKKKRYLLVLDGIEVIQQENGEDYGNFTDLELRNFLFDFSEKTEHRSFCLITSRASLNEFIDLSTYTQYDVDHLSIFEGRELLQKLGVKGSDQEINHIVQSWEGYALVLNLIGSLLVEKFEGDIRRIDEIASPILPNSTMTHYGQVSRVLRRYDEHLSELEKTILIAISAYRLPVLKLEIGTAFSGSQAIVEQLSKYRILRDNTQEGFYTIHPLIRKHYLKLLSELPLQQIQEIHRKIADHYVKIACPADRPLLRDLVPLMEAVYHYCQAGNYDDAFDVFYKKLYMGDRHLIIYELCAYKDTLGLLREFFPNKDVCQDPQVSNLANQRFIFNEIGFCTMNVAKLREAEHFYQKALTISVDQQNWHNASISSNNLAIMHAQLGEFDYASDIANQAIEYAQRVADNLKQVKDKRNALSRRAWIQHLQGNLDEATKDFEAAAGLHRQVDLENPFPYTKSGVWYAEHLRRLGDFESARQIIEENLKVCIDRDWRDDISRCHRVLGNLDEDSNQKYSAQSHYDEALKIAQGIGFREVLIEALLSKGLWAIQQEDLDQGEALLREGLNYIYRSGAKLYEIHGRLGLAWSQLKRGNRDSAVREAERVLRLAEEKKYFWGLKDAQTLLLATGKSL